MRKTTFVSRILFLAVLAAVGVMWATPLTNYSDRTTWLSNTTNQTTTNFDWVGPGGWAMDFTSNGIVRDGVQFVGFQNATTYGSFVSYTPSGGDYDFGTGGIFRAQDKGSWYPTNQVPWIVATLPTSTFSFGVDLMTYLPNGTPNTGLKVNIWIYDGTNTYEYLGLNTNTRGATPAFFGVVSTNAISWVKIQAVDAETIIDNFTTATANQGGGGGGGGGDAGGETPEMATAILILSGLLFLRFGKQKFSFLKNNSNAAAA